MNNKSCQTPQEELLTHFGNLRKMMVHNHELENLSEFVLHQLCTGPCFQIEKAAYFVNNPDFKLLRGVTGYSKNDGHNQLHDTWNNQKQFIAAMKDSSFNQKVRSSLQENFEKGKSSEKDMVQRLADQLEIENPLYHVWNLKYANHGLLIYKPLLHDVSHQQEHLLNSLYYLSFCPIY